MYLNKADNLDVKMNSQEAYDIACDIRRMLEKTAADHWLGWYLKEHSDPSADGFITYLSKKDKEMSRLEKLEFFYGISGHSSLMQDTLYCLKKIFEDKK